MGGVRYPREKAKSEKHWPTCAGTGKVSKIDLGIWLRKKREPTAWHQKKKKASPRNDGDRDAERAKNAGEGDGKGGNGEKGTMEVAAYRACLLSNGAH